MRPLRATYRLHLGPGLDFAAARGLLPYLDGLGISHLCLAPVWQAREDSTGSDGVVAPATVSEVLGGEVGLRALADAAHARGMGLIAVGAPTGAPTDAVGLRGDRGEPRGLSLFDATIGEHRRCADGAAEPFDRATAGASSADGFGVDVQSLFVDPAGEAPLADLRGELRGDVRPSAGRAAQAKDGSLRLRARDEGDGGPRRSGLPVDGFHAANLERARMSPHTLLVTTTPGAEHSGDLEARIGALSGLGEEWAGAVRRWRADNVGLRDDPHGAPTPIEELLIYRTIIGAWPIGLDRLEPFLLEKLREAEQVSRRVETDEAHEQAVLRFVRRLLDHGPFRYGFDGWAARVADVGARASLGQVLLKLTCPGIPDVYQGDELPFLALGGADNCRTVDWDALREALTRVGPGAAPPRDLAKLHLVRTALALRAELPEAFAGTYTPIPAGEEVCAFLRGDDVLVVVAVRESATGTEGWTLPPAAAGQWRDVLGGGEYELPDGASVGAVLGPDGRALLRRAQESCRPLPRGGRGLA